MVKKVTDMDEKREPLVDEEVKHKKKSKFKGQPRSKHKHIYETVLLTKNYHSRDFKTGKPEIHKNTLPTRVCTVCGRIGYHDDNESYYIKKPIVDLPFHAYEKVLSEEALSLPKWHTEDYWDKFAIKTEEE